MIQEGLDHPAAKPACYLVHEIGSGDWYGYIWGRDVANFFSLIDGQRRIASCLHADTLEELTGILCSPPLRVSREALGRVGLILFMHVARHLAVIAAGCPASGRPMARVGTEWSSVGTHGATRLSRPPNCANPQGWSGTRTSSGPAGRGRGRDGGRFGVGSSSSRTES